MKLSELDLYTWEHMQELLEDVKFKKLLIEKLNKHIDLPFFNENTEEKIYESVYDCIVECLTT